MESEKNVYHICPNCKSKETEYDYEKSSDTFIIKCKECGTIISKQDLKYHQPQEKRFEIKRFQFDKRTKLILIGLCIAVILGMLIGETVFNIMNYYQDYTMNSVMNL